MACPLLCRLETHGGGDLRYEEIVSIPSSRRLPIFLLAQQGYHPMRLQVVAATNYKVTILIAQRRAARAAMAG